MTSNKRRLDALTLSVSGSSRSKSGPMVKNNCWECKNRRDVPGNSRIKCVDPDADMTADPHGIRNGWFMYPLLFDPTWMTSKCKNFKPVNRADKSSGKSI